MPSRKEKEDPWWFKPLDLQIFVTEKAVRKCKLHSLKIQAIITAMVKAKYPTRPRRAKRSWVEPVCVDGEFYHLSCHIDNDEKRIVVKNIRVPRKVRRTKRHR